MMHGKTFLICSSALLIFAVINLLVGSIINHKVEDWPWSLKYCEIISDKLKECIEKNVNIETIKQYERKLSECWNKKPMYS